MNIKDFATRWALHYVNPDFLKIPMKDTSVKVYLQLINVQSNTIYKLYNSKNQLIWCSHYKNSEGEFIRGATTEAYNYYGIKDDGTRVTSYVPSGYLIKKMPYMPSKNIDSYKTGPVDTGKYRYGMVLPVGTYYIKIGQSGQPVLQNTYQFSITDQYKSKKEWDDGEGTAYSHHYGTIYGTAIKIIDVVNMTDSVDYDSNDYIYITYTQDYRIVSGSEVYTYTTETTEEQRERYSWWGDLQWMPSNLIAESDIPNKSIVQAKSKFSFYHHLQNGESILMGEIHSWGDMSEGEPDDIVGGSQAKFLENYQYPSRYIYKEKTIYETQKAYVGEWAWNRWTQEIYNSQDYVSYLRSFWSDGYRGYVMQYGCGQTNIQMKNSSFTWPLKKYFETRSRGSGEREYIDFRGYIYADPTKTLIYTYQEILPHPWLGEGYDTNIYEIPPGAVIETPRHYYIDGEEFDYEVKYTYSGSWQGYHKATSKAAWNYPDGEQWDYIQECQNLKPSICLSNGWGTTEYKFINARRAYTLYLRDMTFNAYGAYGRDYTHSGVQVLDLGGHTVNKEAYQAWWKQYDFIEVLRGIICGKDGYGGYSYFVPSTLIRNPSDEDIDFGDFSELVHNFLNWDSYMRIFHSRTNKIYVIDISDIPEYNPET